MAMIERERKELCAICVCHRSEREAVSGAAVQPWITRTGQRSGVVERLALNAMQPGDASVQVFVYLICVRRTQTLPAGHAQNLMQQAEICVSGVAMYKNRSLWLPDHV